MAVSKVEICNFALSIISQEPIVSISSPTSDNERRCAKWYSQAIQFVLSKHPWNFAQKRAMLPQETAPAFGYSHSFALPSDYVRLVQRGLTKSDSVTIYNDYAIEGSSLLLNYSGTGSFPIIYTFNEERVGRYPPWFVNLVAHQLAIYLSPEVNRTQSEINALFQLFDMALQEAKQLDGQEVPAITVTNSRYLRGLQRNSVYTVEE